MKTLTDILKGAIILFVVGLAVNAGMKEIFGDDYGFATVWSLVAIAILGAVVLRLVEKRRPR